MRKKSLHKVLVFLLFILISTTSYSQDSVRFVVNNPDQCFPGNSFSFSSTVSSGIVSVRWDFGDNTSSTNQSPTKSYTEARDYNVTLIGTDGAGINYYSSRKITVHPLPIMNFAVYNGGVVGSTFNFVSTSSITAGFIAIHNWNFGDGTADVGSNVNKSFVTPGSYAVSLMGTSAAGCTNTITQNIVVTPPAPSNGGGATPNTTQASFSVNDTSQCLSGNSFAFTNTTQGSFSYKWYFGNGDSSTANSPVFSYTTSGDYNVTLVATDAAGIKYYHSVKVTVDAMPVMDFNVFPSGVNGTGYTFSSISTIAAGFIQTFNWNFGDGSVATGQNPYKEYLTIGTFNVSLQGISEKGCTTSITKPVGINKSNVARVPASFTINDSLQCITGNSFTYTNTTPINGDEVYAWDLGNGTTAATRNASITYTTPGHYIVKLTVIRNSDTASTTQQVTVYPKPTVNFKILEKQSNGNAYTFIDSSFAGFGNLTYFWDLGDGTTSTLSNPIKEYAGAGTTYTIKLVVTNTEACTDSISKTITTCPKIITTDFTIQQHVICENGNRFSFINNSQTSTTGGSTTTYQWLLGDGSTATTVDVLNKSYDSANDYNVKLIVTNTLGACTVKDSVTKTITVYPKPKVGYVLYLNTVLQNIVAGDTLQLCNNGGTAGGGHDFQYISNASIKRGQMLYNWDFGTNNLTYREGNNTFVNPRIIFRENGLFPVKLKVTSLEGCTDSFTHYVHIVEMGNPEITITEQARQPYQYPQISAQLTSIPPVGQFTYAWSTNGSTQVLSSTNANQVFNFTRFIGGTNQNVSLNISNGAGCSVTINKTFNSIVQPFAFPISATFNGFNTGGQPQYSFQFNGGVQETQSVSLNGNVNFGDGSSTSFSNSNPSANFVAHAVNGRAYTSSVANDTATVTFRLVNNNGNLDSTVSTKISVFAHPLAKVAMRVVPRSIPSNPDMFYIRDTSTIAFGNLFSGVTRTLIVRVSETNGNSTTNTFNFPSGSTTRELATVAVSAPVGTYTVSIDLRYRFTNIFKPYNANLGEATAGYFSTSSSGFGYTTFSSGSGSIGTANVVYVGRGGVTSNIIPDAPFTVHPNPANSFVNITYAPGNTTAVNINVYNNLGNLVKTQRETVALAATQTTRVDVSSLPSGTYRVEVVNSNGLQRIGSSTFIK
jgi:PKD repeat protein